MTGLRSDPAAVLDELSWRGLVAHSTDEAALREVLAGGPIVFYIGFDPTAPSLHIGNLVQILTARRLQRGGHRPLALVGGATGLVGDPSGKSAERALNASEVVASWADRIRSQLEPFFSFDGDLAARMVDNLDWTGAMSALDFLRDVGKHFPVNRMLDRESVSARLASGGLSYTEFSYQVLQANDFLELHRRYGCVLQTGGSDQWGNITAGVDLIRRVTGARVHALATPLLTKADGTKFGKTESGTVWLDPQLTSPYAFFQFWLAADDRDVPTYLRVFTDRVREEIDELERATAERPAERRAQRVLAEDVTSLVHGPGERDRAVAASAALFGRGDLAALDEATLAAALAETPGVRWEPGAPAPSWVDLLERTGLVASRSAGRRALAEGSVSVGSTRLSPDTDPEAGPRREHLLHGHWLVLRRGRRALAWADLAGVELPE